MHAHVSIMIQNKSYYKKYYIKTISSVQKHERKEQAFILVSAKSIFEYKSHPVISKSVIINVM